MWAGPRNISTTMLRSFENRPDTAVFDEPLYAAYLAASGAAHPYRAETLAEYPTTFSKAIDWIEDAPPPGADIVFCKHIAFHYPQDGDLTWLLKQRNFLLIRDPRAMVASYVKKFDDVAPIIDSYRLAVRIRAFLADAGLACPVIDAEDVLRDPAAMMRRLCAALDIPFSETMLGWPAGPRKSDGPWAPHWYDAVEASTGFNPYTPRQFDLPPDLAAAADACAGDYAALRAVRLTP